MSTDQPVETQAFVVVGVDFGTTYTGVAYCHSNDPDHKQVVIITKWPGAVGQTRDKVPTEISYGNSTNGQNKWGWQLRAGSKRYGGFKLLLDPIAGSQAYNDERLRITLDPGNPALQSTLHEGKSATDMMTDYLRLVYAETMEALKRVFAGTFDTLKIKFIITSPAMWSPAAQHNTLMAAKAAGFGSRPQDIMDAVTEPEAAASYALRDIGLLSTPPSGGSVGHQIIVCDAGGGTVDLVAYAIDQIEPYLAVSETTPPRGGLCGATSLDQRFLHLVRKRLGSQAHLLDDGTRGGRGSRLMLAFEDIKCTFGTNDFQEDQLIEHWLPSIVPDFENGIDEQYITLSQEDMKSIFDPVVDKIVGLVDAYLHEAREKEPGKPITGIILVGGFGESVYLFNRLRSWAELQSPPLFLCNPRESWAAVAKGAVCYGLESIVRHRVLPCHYGVELGVAYDSSKGHDPAYNYRDEFYGVTMNRDTVVWFAKKGERIDRDNRITVPFSCPTTDRYARIPLNLRTCRYRQPPMSRRDARVLRAPTATINLRDIPASMVRQRQVGGVWGIGSHTTYMIEGFTLEMVTSSASFKFELRCNGDLLSEQEVDPTFVGTGTQ